MRADNAYAHVIQELFKLTSVSTNSFFIAVYHDKSNFEHFHIIHNCNFSNTCRCSFMQTLPTKRRTENSTKLIYDIQHDYIDNLVKYFLQRGYYVVKILFGSENWKLFRENTSKYILCNIFLIVYILKLILYKIYLKVMDIKDLTQQQIPKDEWWKHSMINVSCRTDAENVISSIRNICQDLKEEFPERSGHCEGKMLPSVK